MRQGADIICRRYSIVKNCLGHNKTNPGILFNQAETVSQEQKNQLQNISQFKAFHLLLSSAPVKANLAGLKQLQPYQTWGSGSLKHCVCFQKHKLTSHEKKFSLNLKKSVRFENFMDLRFCHDLTHKNGRNSPNF